MPALVNKTAESKKGSARGNIFCPAWLSWFLQGVDMSLRDSLGPQLPYLRRYARALTGSQTLGDAAVRETLEALLLAPEEFDETAQPRVELYRITGFGKAWAVSLTPTA
jgi:hypothetical protein